jgi:hypothetical protein
VDVRDHRDRRPGHDRLEGLDVRLAGHRNPDEVGDWFDVLARWDSDWYLRIAESGYRWPSSTPAFFPLYPVLVGGLGRVLGDRFLLAGVLVALPALRLQGLYLALTTMAFGCASSMRAARLAAAKPPNTTEWIAPMRAHARTTKTASGMIGM